MGIRDNNKIVPYHAGVVPTNPPPAAGEKISLSVTGLPPYKDTHFSIRNPRHKIYNRFKFLREQAINVMAGRAPYRGSVRLDFIMYAPQFERAKTLLDYLGGVMDTLDGSHGVDFTYLPIMYEDDCQVCTCRCQFKSKRQARYELALTFL